MSKHTPGPWTVTKLFPEHVEENDYPGAEVSFEEASGHPHDGAIQVWSERAEADARLIAAAPSLLAALEKYVEHYGDPLKVARAAIASATGESNGERDE